jgi:hypothetical protein
MTCFVASGHTQAYSDISERYDGENVSFRKNRIVVVSLINKLYGRGVQFKSPSHVLAVARRREGCKEFPGGVDARGGEQPHCCCWLEDY